MSSSLIPTVTGKLHLRVVSANNLIPIKKFRDSANPYVTVSIPEAGIKYTTATVRSTTEPVWQFADASAELGPFVKASTLRFDVHHSKILLADAELGSATMNLDQLRELPPRSHLTIGLEPPLDRPTETAGSITFEFTLEPFEVANAELLSCKPLAQSLETGSDDAPFVFGSHDYEENMVFFTSSVPDRVVSGAAALMSTRLGVDVEMSERNGQIFAELPRKLDRDGTRAVAFAATIDAALMHGFRVKSGVGHGSAASGVIFVPDSGIDRPKPTLVLEIYDKRTIRANAQLLKYLGLEFVDALRQRGLEPKDDSGFVFDDCGRYGECVLSNGAFSDMKHAPTQIGYVLDALALFGLVLEAVAGRSLFVLRPHTPSIHGKTLDPMPTLVVAGNPDAGLAGLSKTAGSEMADRLQAALPGTGRMHLADDGQTAAQTAVMNGPQQTDIVRAAQEVSGRRVLVGGDEGG
ncbi:uncharacterized protein AMSG_04129 [Thecamonas trahens ATCC 50062]|uniref:C2 domain-containing protein n=1 Tax=Thecamonas trahens ATCC 50062 TaxID=461836 RepID=A0A0L0D9B9_THETB|nr:hypothetical protein AMSG_04129 [Thecamonas trahens ATCC 50062]KNC47898.1 hypothetical protein AMSG_04129 [Thecamonas trahens ATCC 50062]|eukprot:XP_013758920.1 hypothetical protein AMSG_04129 [Thecamonas trahens ATCC 50062]